MLRFDANAQTFHDEKLCFCLGEKDISITLAPY